MDQKENQDVIRCIGAKWVNEIYKRGKDRERSVNKHRKSKFNNKQIPKNKIDRCICMCQIAFMSPSYRSDFKIECDAIGNPGCMCVLVTQWSLSNNKINAIFYYIWIYFRWKLTRIHRTKILERAMEKWMRE